MSAAARPAGNWPFGTRPARYVEAAKTMTGLRGETNMSRVSRRSVLRLSGAGAAAATTGGLAGILASGRAPAYAQTATVHWLKWNDFVPAADEHLRKKAIPEAEKALGMKITLETIGLNDLPARSTAAIQSKSGP